MAEIRFVLTNDDAGMQEPALFAQLLDFLDEQAVRATFFVVPYADGVALDAKPAWIDLLQRAHAGGHELQHHAWRHDSCFEFGIPPDFMLEIMPDAAQRVVYPSKFLPKSPSPLRKRVTHD